MYLGNVGVDPEQPIEVWSKGVSNIIKKLYEVGQSIWCDNISRHMIDSGELQELIDFGVVGVTSNPTIFMKAITGSTDYDKKLHALLQGQSDRMAIYEGLVLPDITDAADILKPVFDRTNGVDGYVSLEVNPKLAYDTQGTIAEAKRLAGELDRPNVFIKVPATDEGIPAIEAIIAEGISVNVTLIFGIGPYEKVMEAYLAGLKKYHQAGGKLDSVSSVASFFVSRVDGRVDQLLKEKQDNGANIDHLLSKAAIANAKLAYARYQEVFEKADGEFAALAAQGARVQRPLWASTSAKNPNHSSTRYVDGLVARNTVNTIPPATIQATLEGGTASIAIDQGVDEAKALIDELESMGISIEEVTNDLRKQGVELFAQSFDELLANIDEKTERLRAVG